MTQKKTVAVLAPKPTAPVGTSVKITEVPKTVVTLTRSTKERKGSSIVFLIPGVRGSVKIARTAFVGEPPMALDVVGQPFAPPVVTMTKEERAAARAAMTPLQKAAAARERANRASVRATRLEAAAAR